MDAQEREVPDQEKALAKKYAGLIAAAYRVNERRFKRYEKHRQLFAGDANGKLVRTNLILSTISTLIPQIYAKNPDVSVGPGDSVDETQFDVVKKFGKTVEVVLGKKLVREAKLKARAKALLRASMTCAVGWLKLTYQKDVREDPIVKSRLADIQENVERLKALEIKAADNQTTGDTMDVTLAELEAQRNALSQQLEVTISEGFVIDKIHTEDLVILDTSIRDFDDYVLAGALAQRIPMSCEEFETRFKRKPQKTAKTWYADNAAAVRASGDATSATGKEGEQQFIKVFEIWCRSSNTVYTWCEGEEGWCREPYNPQGLGKRWYPYFALCLNPVDGQFYGVSDIELLAGLQEEYTQIRDDFAKTRKHALPIKVVRAGSSLTEEDIENIKKAQPGDTVVVSGDAANPIGNDVQVLTGPQIDPALFDVSPIMRDIELVSGAQDAARGVVNTAKTATEAEIMQNSLNGRVSERQDCTEDLIEDMAVYCTEVALHELTAEQVQRIAGPSAVWPQAGSPDEVMDLLAIEIRAGSSGKPDRNRERQQWIEMLPVVQEAMAKVMELRQSGQQDMADAVVELVRETFRRFDERIDVAALLPKGQEGQQDPGQAIMQLQQAQEQMAAMQEEGQQLAEQLQTLQAEKMAAFQTREIEDQRNAAQFGMQERVENAKISAGNYEARMAEMQQQMTQMSAQLEQANAAIEQKGEEVWAMQQEVLAAKQEVVAAQQQAVESERAIAEKLATMTPPVAPPAPAPAPITLTIPVTIEASTGKITKTATGKVNPDGTFTMKGTEG